jgi:hypothetical protein
MNMHIRVSTLLAILLLAACFGGDDESSGGGGTSAAGSSGSGGASGHTITGGGSGGAGGTTATAGASGGASGTGAGGCCPCPDQPQSAGCIECDLFCPDGSSGAGGASGSGGAGGSGTGGVSAPNPCPDTPPTDGTPCTEAEAALCTYVDCNGAGWTNARCQAPVVAMWLVQNKPCEPVTCSGGDLVCEPGQVCVETRGGPLGIECMDNPCGTGPQGCDCPGVCDTCSSFSNDTLVCNACPAGEECV